MPDITDLPVEILASILENLDNIRFLPNVLLACRPFYTAYRETPCLADAILGRQIGRNIRPYGLAAQALWYDASSLHARERILRTLHHESPEMLHILKDKSLAYSLEIGHRHDVIHDLALRFGRSAWSLMSHDTPLVLSDLEYDRFCRAFYRFEILCLLIETAGEDSPPDESPARSPKRALLARHAPWECEQIACVQDFVEEQLAGAIREILAHDLTFGELAEDYLSRRVDNDRLQQRLARGLPYLCRVEGALSYADKAALLHEYHNGFVTTPWEQLASETDDGAHDGDVKTLGEYTESDWAALAPGQHPPDDTDPGPREAWCLAHDKLPGSAFVLSSENSGRRERAYVLWDMHRLQQYDLFRVLDEAPERQLCEPGDEEWLQMEHSWAERSAIWQQGGRGYWAEGDMSRVEWPNDPNWQDGRG